MYTTRSFLCKRFLGVKVVRFTEIFTKIDCQERVSVAANIWTARIIPFILAGIVVYISFVLVGPLCGTKLTNLELPLQ